MEALVVLTVRRQNWWEDRWKGQRRCVRKVAEVAFGQGGPTGTYDNDSCRDESRERDKPWWPCFARDTVQKLSARFSLAEHLLATRRASMQATD